MVMLFRPQTETTDAASQQQSEIERRRGLRIRQQRAVKVFVPLSGRYYGGRTADVSATGLRIELPVGAPLRPGRLLSVHVGPSAEGQGLAHRRQMIPARVVWLDRSTAPDRGVMMAGLEFQTAITAQMDAA